MKVNVEHGNKLHKGIEFKLVIFFFLNQDKKITFISSDQMATTANKGKNNISSFGQNF